LPVYEIYKVGQDVHVVDGLNFFSDFGLHVSFVPHWNNAEGGADLDTSRCFMGMERFSQWCDLLPEENIIVGLDEHTGVIFDFESGQGEINGVSSVSLLSNCAPVMHPAGTIFPIKELGELKLPEPFDSGIPSDVWEMVANAPSLEEDQPPHEVVELAESRFVARAEKNWAESDRLREEIASRGWSVQDEKNGYKLVRN
jgi:hypothetical protein